MKIIIIAGSNHSESSSTSMARYVGEKLKSDGHEAVLWDLYKQPLPFYSPADNQTFEPVQQLSGLVADANAIVLATPEYHGSLSGVLKNALDYLDGEHFGGKMVLSISSAGGAVGVSSLQQLQAIVRNLHGISCPEWISIGGDQRRFDEHGEPLNASLKARVERVLNTFVSLSQKLNA